MRTRGTCWRGVGATTPCGDVQITELDHSIARRAGLASAALEKVAASVARRSTVDALRWAVLGRALLVSAHAWLVSAAARLPRGTRRAARLAAALALGVRCRGGRRVSKAATRDQRDRNPEKHPRRRGITMTIHPFPRFGIKQFRIQHFFESDKARGVIVESPGVPTQTAKIICNRFRFFRFRGK